MELGCPEVAWIVAPDRVRVRAARPGQPFGQQLQRRGRGDQCGAGTLEGRTIGEQASGNGRVAERGPRVTAQDGGGAHAQDLDGRQRLCGPARTLHEVIVVASASPVAIDSAAVA